MRKISAAVILDSKTFEPIMQVRVKGEDGSVAIFKNNMEPSKYSNFTVLQLNTIDGVNKLLEKNNQNILTQEEAEFLIYPFGRHNEEPTEEDLQKLAGFTVEKKITYESK